MDDNKLLAAVIAGFALFGAGYFYGRNSMVGAVILAVTFICLFYLGLFDGASDLLFPKLT